MAELATLAAAFHNAPDMDASDKARNALANEIVFSRKSQAAWIDGLLYVVGAPENPQARVWYWPAGTLIVLRQDQILKSDF